MCVCVVQALGGGGQVIVTVWTDLTHVFIWYSACHHADITCDNRFPSPPPVLFPHCALCLSIVLCAALEGALWDV